jgi:hypothetical protein
MELAPASHRQHSVDRRTAYLAILSSPQSVRAVVTPRRLRKTKMSASFAQGGVNNNKNNNLSGIFESNPEDPHPSNAATHFSHRVGANSAQSAASSRAVEDMRP